MPPTRQQVATRTTADLLSEQSQELLAVVQRQQRSYHQSMRLLRREHEQTTRLLRRQITELRARMGRLVRRNRQLLHAVNQRDITIDSYQT